MAQILFAWELGGGLGHLTPLVPLVRRLRECGHRVVAAARDLSRIDTLFAGIDVTYLQAPVKMARSADQFDPPRTFAHILHNNGFAQPAELRAMAGAWRSLYRLVDPDLVVFDHSPTALLAARDLPARPPLCGSRGLAVASCSAIAANFPGTRRAATD